jgi:hypothetical protein
MNIEKANEVLAKNSLCLDNGLENLPMIKTVEIEIFEIMNKSKSHPDSQATMWYEKAHLMGIVENNNGTSSAHHHHVGDLTCCSFLVILWHTYYYRDFFYEAMEVIEALRTVNEYKHPFPEENITITL